MNENQFKPISSNAGYNISYEEKNGIVMNSKKLIFQMKK